MAAKKDYKGLIYWTVVQNYLGHMTMAATDAGLCRLSFDEDEQKLAEKFPKAKLQRNDTLKIFVQTAKAVDSSGPYDDIALDIHGTEFQQSVWDQLRKIPAGETRSYSDIARAMDNPKAVRAVGSANGANGIAIIIPCHRVIGSDGGLAGYAYGLTIKEKLLRREGVVLNEKLLL